MQQIIGPCRVAIVAALLGLAGAGAATVRAAARAEPAPPNQSPVFRSGVDVILVDVQVVDGDGNPATGLGPADFEVTISGRRRRVVSVDLIDYRAVSPAAPNAASQPMPEGSRPAAAPAPRALDAGPRVYVLAVDAASLDEATARPILQAAARFIDALSPTDEVGLFTFPIGPKLDPTTDHAAVARALDGVMARRETAWTGEFTLFPSDLVELSFWTAGRPVSGAAEALLLAICPPAPEEPNEPSAECLQRLEPAARSAIMIHEGIAQTTIGTLRALVAELGRVPMRKTLVIVSGGLVTADQPGGRPDGTDLGVELGKIAAEANVSTYTLFVDRSDRQALAAESRTARNSLRNAARDSQIYSQWLDRFSGAAGGALIPVRLGDGGSAFDRILAETSAYYLLAVEPEAQDRNNRARELNVKVRGRGLDVRGRSWVVVPSGGASRPGSEAPAAISAAGPRTGGPVESGAPPPRVGLPITPALRALADAFDRNDRVAIATAIAGPTGVTLVRAVRESENPWPAAPRRLAAFALDVSLTGLRAASHFTREESLRLLAEHTVRVRQADPDDPFECAWLRAQAAALAGLHSPQVAMGFAERAVTRCPGDPRVRLNAAVVLDQLTHQVAVLQTPDAARTTMAEDEHRLVEAYAAAAAASPDVWAEARIRAAWVHHRAGRSADGLALLEDLPPVLDDPQLQYFQAVVRGQLLRTVGRADAAVAALRSGLDTWPGGQTARVALMTLLIERGAAAEAAAIAEQVQWAGPDVQDPWWLFPLGEYRMYGELRDRLRELTR